MKPPKRAPAPLLKIFAIPALLAALSMFGLIAALLGNNLYDVLAWIALAIPLFVIVAMMLRRP